MEKKNNFPVSNIGTVLLVVVLITLSMVTFATLSLSESMRDKKYTEKLSEHTSQYYDASNAAEKKLSQIDGILTEAAKTASDEAEYYDAAIKKLQEIGVEAVDKTVTYTVEMNEKEGVQVNLELLNPEEQRLYKIAGWQEIPLREWKADNKLKLIE